MYHDNLRERILIDPVVNQGYKTLCIVSGYAEPSMVGTHLEDWLQNQSPRGYQYQVYLNLIVGMFPKGDWPGEDNRRIRASYFAKMSDFAELTRFPIGATGSRLDCRYVLRRPQLHAKLYVWLDAAGQPAKAFIGSPNYSKTAFRQDLQGEIATVEGNPEECYEYFLEHWNSAVSCTEPDIKERFRQLIGWQR